MLCGVVVVGGVTGVVDFGVLVLVGIVVVVGGGGGVGGVGEFSMLWMSSVWLGWKIIRKFLFTLREDDPDENKKVQ